jgi:rhomboid family GlyGly-CTERM serine protease
MATSAPRLGLGRWGGWPSLAVALALVVYAVPGAESALIYDRAAILDGEVWRLITGHWVHFSRSHLGCDAAVLAISGWLIEARRYRYFLPLCVLSAVAIGLALLAILPDLAVYGGLSGLAMASTVYLALHALDEPPPWRGAAVAILVACAGKVVLEALTGEVALIGVDRVRVAAVPLSHIVGAITGAAVYLWSRREGSVALGGRGGTVRRQRRPAATGRGVRMVRP